MTLSATGATPGSRVEPATYLARVVKAEEVLSQEKATPGLGVQYELSVDGESRPWNESYYAPGWYAQVFNAVGVTRWVKKEDPDFEQTKLDEWNANAEKPASAYLVDSETGAVYLTFTPADINGKSLRVKIAERPDGRPGRPPRRQIVAFLSAVETGD